MARAALWADGEEVVSRGFPWPKRLTEQAVVKTVAKLFVDRAFLGPVTKFVADEHRIRIAYGESFQVLIDRRANALGRD